MHAAVSGPMSEEESDAVDFYVDHHHAERSGMVSGGERAPRGDVSHMVVPRRTCGAVYIEATQGDRSPPFMGAAAYVKIDIEGQDMPCLRSLLESSDSCYW